jgi:hypothetical protein
MRSIKLLGLAAVTAVALTAFVGVSSAFAVAWSPQNTVEPASLASGSSLVLTNNKGNTVTCNTVTSSVEAPIGGNAAVAGTVNSSGAATPPSFTNCSSNLGSASVSASGQWLFTATSATSVDASHASSSVSIAGGICHITVSNAAVAGNTWSNTSHQLALNSGASFPISESGFCDGATSAKMSGTLQLPTAVTIG